MKKNVLALSYIGFITTILMINTSCCDDPIEPLDPNSNNVDTTWYDDSTNNNPNDSTWNDPNGGGNTNPNDSSYTNPNDSTWNDPNDSTWWYGGGN